MGTGTSMDSEKGNGVMVEMMKGKKNFAIVGEGHSVYSWIDACRDLYDPPCPECNSRNAMVITTDFCEHPVDCVCRNCGAWFSTDDK